MLADNTSCCIMVSGLVTVIWWSKFFYKVSANFWRAEWGLSLGGLGPVEQSLKLAHYVPNQRRLRVHWGGRGAMPPCYMDRYRHLFILLVSHLFMHVCCWRTTRMGRTPSVPLETPSHGSRRTTGSRRTQTTPTRAVREAASSKDLVTGREIWLPTGNRVSRAPTVIGVTEQKISNLFEFFEF
jgi:hypothetical protein